MELALYGKSLELTPALRSYVQQRLDKLDRFFPASTAVANVVLSVQRERQTVEVTVPFEGLILRAEDSEGSMYAAVDLVLEKLERQIHKFKTRMHRKLRHSGMVRPEAGVATAGAVEAASAEVEDELVRTKHFPLKPMTVEEALLQMSLLGHDFFVFREAGSEEVQVVYHRRHGGYGLIVGR